MGSCLSVEERFQKLSIPPGQEYLDLNVFLPWRNGQLLETLLNAQARVSVASHPDTLSGWRLVWKRRYKNSNDLMLISEVRASKEWIQSEEMRPVFFNASGEQIRGHWTFFRNFDFGDPRRTFFPKLQTNMTEETQTQSKKRSRVQIPVEPLLFEINMPFFP